MLQGQKSFTYFATCPIQTTFLYLNLKKAKTFASNFALIIILDPFNPQDLVKFFN